MLCTRLSFLCFCPPPQGSPKSHSWFQFSDSRYPIPYLQPGASSSSQHTYYLSFTTAKHGAACTPGYALDVGVNQKPRSHLLDCPSVGVDILLVAETHGGLEKDSIRIIQAIGKTLGKRTNPDDPSLSTKLLFGRLAIALWWDNACCWLHHSPFIHPSLDSQI